MARIHLQALVVVASIVGAGLGGCMAGKEIPEEAPSSLVTEGESIFRYDTFGDEQLWTDKLRLNEVVENQLQPLEALGLGLKVDLDKLSLGRFVLSNPFGVGGTKELLRQNAVVGVQAVVDDEGHIVRLGITCAFCHSTVDDALLPGIGHRLDGWPNRDLDVGAVIALSPTLTAEQKAVYSSWGPGKYDPRFNLDGQSTPLVIPPAYGLAHVENETYTAEAPISYWNAYVAVTQMGGQGTFSDARLGIDIEHSPDRVTPKLAALAAYQHSLQTPAPEKGSFDIAGAERGSALFERNCSSCHVGGTGTDNNDGKLHEASETGVDGAYAARTVNKAYRTTPLRGLSQHPPYFHDGSVATLEDVVAHYDQARALALTEDEQSDLVEYLKSL